VKTIAFVVLLYGFCALVTTAEMTSPQDDTGITSDSSTWSNSVSGVARSFHFTTGEKWLLVFYVFVSIWIECFFNALYQFIIAYAMAEYHQSPMDHDGDRDIGGGCCALWDGVSVALYHHCGSLAFGSAIVAALWVVELIVKFLEAQNKEQGNNACVACILRCLESLVACCRELVEFLNKNAYVYMAITGNAFCDSAKAAMGVLASIPGAMAVLNGATLVFSLFGVLFVASGTGAFTFFLTGTSTFSDQSSSYYVESPAVVAAVAAVMGGGVALCFMLVFDMASDALLFYFGLDLQSGSSGSSNAPQAIKELVRSNSS